MSKVEMELKRLSKIHRDNVRFIRYVEPLVDFSEAMVHELWTTNEDRTENKARRYNLSLSWRGDVDLTLYLSKIDSIKYDIEAVLERLLDCGFELDREDHNKGTHKSWLFRHEDYKWKDVNGDSWPIGLHVYFNYSNSGRCQVVKTGKVTVTEMKNEETILVCED